MQKDYVASAARWLALAALFLHQGVAQETRVQQFSDGTTGARTIGCPAPSFPARYTVVVKPELVLQDKLRVREELAKLLTESIIDDSKGITNAAREKRIKQLANKLR